VPAQRAAKAGPEIERRAAPTAIGERHPGPAEELGKVRAQIPVEPAQCRAHARRVAARHLRRHQRAHHLRPQVGADRQCEAPCRLDDRAALGRLAPALVDLGPARLGEQAVEQHRQRLLRTVAPEAEPDDLAVERQEGDRHAAR
jgi:hypothetical protein